MATNDLELLILLSPPPETLGLQVYVTMPDCCIAGKTQSFRHARQTPTKGAPFPTLIILLCN